MLQMIFSPERGEKRLEEYVIEGIVIDNREELLDYLMLQYGNDLLKLVYSYVRNYAISEELTQEIFIKSYERLHTYKGKSSLKTWLWRIAINHCKDYLRSWNYRKVIISEQLVKSKAGKEASVEREVMKKTEDELLAEKIIQLPVKYREVIFLHYYEDLSMKEIEMVTGINQNTIKTRLKRAKELLKKKLEGELEWKND